MPPKLTAVPSLDGKMNIVYERTDVPLMHVIVKADGGAPFTLEGHFERCPVCKHHGVTQSHFDEWYQKLQS